MDAMLRGQNREKSMSGVRVATAEACVGVSAAIVRVGIAVGDGDCVAVVVDSDPDGVSWTLTESSGVGGLGRCQRLCCVGALA